jgi:hypothetical protein
VNYWRTLASKHESKSESNQRAHLSLCGRRNDGLGGMMHQAKNLTEDEERVCVEVKATDKATDKGDAL